MNPLWVVLVAAVVGFLVWYLGRIPAARPNPIKASRGNAPSEDVPSMSGAVAQMPLSEVFQYLSASAASGLLKFSSGRRTGDIEFARGRIVSASYRRSTGMDALLALLGEPQGDFRFSKAAHPAETGQGIDVLEVIMVWMDSRSQEGDE